MIEMPEYVDPEDAADTQADGVLPTPTKSKSKARKEPSPSIVPAVTVTVAYRSRVDLVRMLEAVGWSGEAPVLYRRGEHRLHVYSNSAAFVCSCCVGDGEQCFGAVYERVVRRGR